MKHLSCREDNDLISVLKENRIEFVRHDSPAQAIRKAEPKAGVMILADGYPDRTTRISPSLLKEAAKKKLRLYIEYPSRLQGLKIKKPQPTQWERTVVASNVFGAGLEKLRLLAIQDCRFVPTKAKNAHLVMARVAGFDSAVYGLPDKKVFPILFEVSGKKMLVATTKLSQFVTARYAPTDAWQIIWGWIIGWMDGSQKAPRLRWTPTVRPSFGKTERLPVDAELNTVKRGVGWYINGRMLMHPAYVPLQKNAMKRAVDDGTTPGPKPGLPLGDGSLGIIESYSSRIDWQGKQPVRWFTRTDCCCESAMAFAFLGQLNQDQQNRKTAANLLNFVTRNSPVQQEARANPKSPSYGLMGWDTRPQGVTIYYGDDNARAMLAMMATAGLLRKADWDEALLRCALANFRTSGPEGFRAARIDEPQLQENGWRWYWEKSDGTWGGNMKYSPHYQAYLWAVNLWLYDKTRFPPLLTRTRNAIRQQMKRFPGRWDFECGRKTAEYARMLLPLAWLIRIEDTPEHRQWLRKVAHKIMEVQDVCGAIRETVTGGEKNNEEYGTREASLIFSRKDACVDLLYTMNFAFLAMHEASVSTGDKRIRSAEDRMADFLVRIQVRSDRPSELDGAWFRGFDFKKWDYWGSNADIGWGVWSTETGWTQAWITSVLAMRCMKTSLWDLTARSKAGKHLNKWLRKMEICDL